MVSLMCAFLSAEFRNVNKQEEVTIYNIFLSASRVLIFSQFLKNLYDNILNDPAVALIWKVLKNRHTFKGLQQEILYF
jgi:hypothetical protein